MLADQGPMDIIYKETNQPLNTEEVKRIILEKIKEKSQKSIENCSKDHEIPKEPSAAPWTKGSSRRAKRSFKDSAERLNRTIFVGNVPSKSCVDKQLKREFKAIFSSYGRVESIRFRSLALPGAMPRKHAFISGQLSEQVDSNNAYVVMGSSEDAQKCISENGRVFHGHHLRLDIAGSSGKLPSHKKSVFIGNLPFDIPNETVWTAFSDCGTVASVRIVRDKKTGMGKGFAYVAFKDRSSVKTALLLDGQEINGRSIRVQKCSKPGKEPGKQPKSANPKKHYPKTIDYKNNTSKIRRERPRASKRGVK